MASRLGSRMEINVEMLLPAQTHQSGAGKLSYKDGGCKLYDPVPLLAQLRARGVINWSLQPPTQHPPSPSQALSPTVPGRANGPIGREEDLSSGSAGSRD